MLRSICIISHGYPTEDDPVYAFIRPLVCQMTEAGIRCTVIAPQSKTAIQAKRIKKRPYKWIDKTESGKSINIYQPTYVSFSNIKICGLSVSAFFREREILKTFEKERIKADVIYGHFWDCGMVAAKIGKKQNLPVYIASGESTIEVTQRYPMRIIKKRAEVIKGLICVSSKNFDESNSLGLLNNKIKTTILPNGFDPKEFYVIDRVEARTGLGLPKGDIIGIYVGEFSERKGSERVIEAAKNVPDIKLIMLGSGNELSDTSQVLYNGVVAHDKLVKYLNAADFFILPTLAEGCCNAIIEALACGLPVISSNLPFNWDVLNDGNSLLIDPHNIDELSKAMKTLALEADLRGKLSKGALKTAKDLRIDVRTRRIERFLKDPC